MGEKARGLGAGGLVGHSEKPDLEHGLKRLHKFLQFM